MSVSHALSFVRRYIRAPDVTGAVAPSSRYLASALTAPFAACDKPTRAVLEIGAGTGPVTRFIGELLGPDDRLDVCELQPALADILDRDVLSRGPLNTARQEGRVRLICGPVEEIDAPNTYDFIISGLPFTAFKLNDVRRIIAVIRRNLKPDGTFSYFEYAALRGISRTFALGTRRRRVREVSDHLDHLIARHQVAKHTVWRNLPPAYGRHWKFDCDC